GDWDRNGHGHGVRHGDGDRHGHGVGHGNGVGHGHGNGHGHGYGYGYGNGNGERHRNGHRRHWLDGRKLDGSDDPGGSGAPERGCRWPGRRLPLRRGERGGRPA